MHYWHLLPKSVAKAEAILSPEFSERSLNSGHHVILYMHGNSGTRAGRHRVELYKVLQSLDVHIVAFDYRGYGDSSPIPPTEDGVVQDGKSMYKWLRKRIGNSLLILWGHSLGTGIATKVAKELCIEGDPPDGLVLEAPFNNLPDEVKSHPLSKIYRFLPGFEYFFLDPLRKYNLIFESDKNIKHVTSSILILHAEDDNIVPFGLGYKLYESAVQGRESSLPQVEFVRFSGEYNYQHRYICKAPELPDIVRKFIKRSSKQVEERFSRHKS